MTDRKTILLAAGGTGGHLFPAFALAEELGRRGYDVDLVTDMRGDRYGTGFPARAIYQVPSATPGSKRSPIALARTMLTLTRGVLASRKLMAKVKPAAIVGFGGYPTVPPLIAARMAAIPTAIHEQNAVLGRANRVLAKSAKAIATSFRKVRFLDGALTAKARHTGNPVRGIVLEAARTPYPALDATSPIRLTVFGGSQGARFFSDAVPPALAALPEALRQRLIVVQQAREEDVDRVKAAYAAAKIQADIAPFFKNLPEIMAASHLVVARAGASSVAELAVIGRPSILVPLPHALDSDQLANATNLAESGGSWCIEQRLLIGDRLTRDLDRLLLDPALLIQAAAAAKAQGEPAAVMHLADLVEELAGSRPA